MSWIDEAKVIKSADRIISELEIQKELSRIEGIVAEKATAGLQKVTVQQAHTFIDSKLNAATTVAQVKEAIRDILKKMVPYLLD